MPGFDGTGPRGLGPLTGRGLGPCGGVRTSRLGRWFGRGRGLGWGFPLRYGPSVISDEPVRRSRLTADEEKELLSREKELLEAEKKAIEREIEEIEKALEE